VIGGGLLRGAGWFGPLRDQIGELLGPSVQQLPTMLRPARHGDLSPLRGAAALARGEAHAWAFLGEPAG